MPWLLLGALAPCSTGQLLRDPGNKVYTPCPGSPGHKVTEGRNLPRASRIKTQVWGCPFACSVRSGHSRSARLSRRNSKEKPHGLCSLGVQIAPLREVLLAGQMPQPGSPPTTAGNAASLASRPRHCLLPALPCLPGAGCSASPQPFVSSARRSCERSSGGILSWLAPPSRACGWLLLFGLQHWQLSCFQQRC